MTKSENVVPGWMKQKRQEIEAATLKRELDDRRALTAHLLVERDGPKFWKSLKEKLNITVNALSSIGLTGSFSSPINSAHVHIEVLRPGNFPNLTNVDLHFYGNKICCTGLTGAYELCMGTKYNNKVGAQSAGRPTAYLDADQASEFVMRRMTDQVLR